MAEAPQPVETPARAASLPRCRRVAVALCASSPGGDLLSLQEAGGGGGGEGFEIERKLIVIDSKHKHPVTELSCSERHLRRRIKPIMDDGYQNEDYWNEDYQNDIVSDKLSHNAEVSSESEHGSAVSLESVVLNQQGYENAVQEYEYIGFSGIRLRTLPEKGEEREPALFTFEDGKWGPFGRKPFMIFSVLLLCSLIIITATLIMACLRCKCRSEEGKLFWILLLCSSPCPHPTPPPKTFPYIAGFPKCADDWHKFQEKCYHYSTEKMGQNTARSCCQALGADLIVIESENEQSQQ
ncbi:uncharacterized protein LOC117039249 [Lacerta agilis]|uniref:uncharacterized protein LOC117039249 n=1 Tax=Lacerta agilis TaxID=80427 RepID=UPI00141A2F17|nr:uncharacterized protein LOC117039249 [Lacerta agilis]